MFVTITYFQNLFSFVTPLSTCDLVLIQIEGRKNQYRYYRTNTINIIRKNVYLAYYKRVQCLPLRNKGPLNISYPREVITVYSFVCSFWENLMMLQNMQLAKLWISQKPEYIFDWLYIKGNSPQHGARQVQSSTNLILKQGEEFQSSLKDQIVKCCNCFSLN